MNPALPSDTLPFRGVAPVRTRPARQGLGEAITPESRYARRIVSHLDHAAADLPHDLTERLRFARELAVQRARLARIAEAAAASRDQPARTASVRGEIPTPGAKPGAIRWWARLAAVVPALALIGGLMLIQHQHVAAQIKAAADIDTALLADDLPPAAYADPAFSEFLKTSREVPRD